MFRGLCRARDRLVDLDDAAPIADIARTAAISPYHFIRRFHAVFGETPHQFRTRRRLERAKQLLGDGVPVTEVCLAVGFTSLGTFSDLFRRRIGHSPTAYRRAVVQVPATLRAPSCYELFAIAISKKHAAREMP
ncbi:MAG TPA: helix-turn-helix transcriptional regulator [Kofleriaceae bacterium]|nr:helix-turn-helix transcriptional regulator [Kofleriaceae bacterium]